MSQVDHDDHPPPEHRAADQYADLILKLDGELPPHAFQQSRAPLLAAMLPPTEQPDGAQGDPVQGTSTTKPQQPDLGDDIHTAHPFLNPLPIGAPGGAAVLRCRGSTAVTPHGSRRGLIRRSGAPAHGARAWAPPLDPAVRRGSPAIAGGPGVRCARPAWWRVAAQEVQDRRALLRAAALWTPRLEDGASHPYPAPRLPAQRCGTPLGRSRAVGLEHPSVRSLVRRGDHPRRA
jgi:hypothetical protein